MALSRRGFLGRLLGTAAAAIAVDPEELLWTPGKVKIFDLGAMPALTREDEIRELLREQTFPWLRINSCAIGPADWKHSHGRPCAVVGQLDDGSDIEYYPLGRDSFELLQERPSLPTVTQGEWVRGHGTPLRVGDILEPGDDLQRSRNRLLRALRKGRA